MTILLCPTDSQIPITAWSVGGYYVLCFFKAALVSAATKIWYRRLYKNSSLRVLVALLLLGITMLRDGNNRSLSYRGWQRIALIKHTSHNRHNNIK